MDRKSSVNHVHIVDERSGQGYFGPRRRRAERVGALGAELACLGPLRPGLPAEIIVPMRKRTALQYLLEPLNQSLWSSFRES